jgi:hypothetical protein
MELYIDRSTIGVGDINSSHSIMDKKHSNNTAEQHHCPVEHTDFYAM